MGKNKGKAGVSAASKVNNEYTFHNKIFVLLSCYNCMLSLYVIRHVLHFGCFVLKFGLKYDKYNMNYSIILGL